MKPRSQTHAAATEAAMRWRAYSLAQGMAAPTWTTSAPRPSHELLHHHGEQEQKQEHNGKNVAVDEGELKRQQKPPQKTIGQLRHELLKWEAVERQQHPAWLPARMQEVEKAKVDMQRLLSDMAQLQERGASLQLSELTVMRDQKEKDCRDAEEKLQSLRECSAANAQKLRDRRMEAARVGAEVHFYLNHHHHHHHHYQQLGGGGGGGGGEKWTNGWGWLVAVFVCVALIILFAIFFEAM